MHAFGMPIFDSPQIPKLAPGQFGPTFGIRPTPRGFPGASVAGMGGVGLAVGCGACGGLGAAPSYSTDYNAKACREKPAGLGWKNKVAVYREPPYLRWAPGAPSAQLSSCRDEILVASTVAYQAEHGLKADGKLGPKTLAQLKVDAGVSPVVAAPKNAPPPPADLATENDPPGTTPDSDTLKPMASATAGPSSTLRTVLLVGGGLAVAAGLWYLLAGRGKKGAKGGASLYDASLTPGFSD